MKKLVSFVVLAAIALTAAFNARAIEDPDAVGTIKVGARIGVDPGFGTNISGDYVLIDSWWRGHFTVGGFAGFRLYSKTQDVGYGLVASHSQNNFSVMPRATYGLNITDKFEVHAGAMTGIYFAHDKTKFGDDGLTETENRLALDYGTFIGCDYFFSGNLGVTAEAGYFASMTYINAGIVLKF